MSGVCSSLHVAAQGGLLFGLPVVLDTDRDDIAVGDKVLLQYQGDDIAVVEIDSKWVPNKPIEALKCYGTTSIEHPAVQMITMERGKYYLGTLRLAKTGGCIGCTSQVCAFMPLRFGAIATRKQLCTPVGVLYVHCVRILPAKSKYVLEPIPST